MTKQWNRMGALCLLALGAQGCGDADTTLSVNNAPVQYEEQALERSVPTASASISLSSAQFKHTQVIAQGNSIFFGLEGKYRLPTKAIHLDLMSNNGFRVRHTEDKTNQMTVARPKDDGLYQWRLVRQPQLDEDAVAPLKRARAEGNLKDIEKLTRALRAEGVLPTTQERKENVSSGTFRIKNGQIVDPKTPENAATLTPNDSKGY